jgi:hypothetical protein
MPNNFTNGDQKNRKWKLWVAYHPGSKAYKTIGRNKTYYNHEPDTEKNRKKLIKNCFLKKEDEIQVAILYDNQTKKELHRLK